jgi:hypothetical protein
MTNVAFDLTGASPRVDAQGAVRALNRRPLSCTSRPFAGLILKGAKGSKWARLIEFDLGASSRWLDCPRVDALATSVIRHSAACYSRRQESGNALNYLVSVGQEDWKIRLKSPISLIFSLLPGERPARDCFSETASSTRKPARAALKTLQILVDLGVN